MTALNFILLSLASIAFLIQFEIFIVFGMMIFGGNLDILYIILWDSESCLNFVLAGFL